MTDSSTRSPEAAPRATAAQQQQDDATKLARLETMRRRATGLLVFAGVVFIVARIFEPMYPWLGFVHATAEASLVGGLADWFAVTALFRKPLGLPIPHTAIVPTQKDRIGRILGNFVQNHFLTRDVVSAKLRAMHLSERAAQWLSTPENSRRIARQFATGLAKTIEALPEDEVRALIQRTAVARIQATRVAPILGNVLGLVTTDERHQELLDEAIRVVAGAVEANQDTIRDKIMDESPWWMPGVVDDVIYQKVMAGIQQLLDDVRSNPSHPVRARFDAALEEFIEKLKHSPEVNARAEALKAQVLEQPLVEEIAASVWEAARRAVARFGTMPDGESTEALERGVAAVGESLLANEALLKELDDFLVHVVSSALEQHRHEVAELIAQTVSVWDPEIAARRVELAVGSDLQYIRINGTLVGGLAGLVIYSVSLLF